MDASTNGKNGKVPQGWEVIRNEVPVIGQPYRLTRYRQLFEIELVCQLRNAAGEICEGQVFLNGAVGSATAKCSGCQREFGLATLMKDRQGQLYFGIAVETDLPAPAPPATSEETR